MLKKILIQIFLFILIIIILTFFYLKYIDKENKTRQDNKEIVESSIEKGNIITDINYETRDFEGRKYVINSQKGLVNKDNPNIIEMELVSANVILNDGTIISIVSDHAVYDNVKYDTKFRENIEIKYLDHVIKSNDLVVSFERNHLEAYNNLTYENLDLIMKADKIIFDFISKNTKIFNFDKSNITIKNK